MYKKITNSIQVSVNPVFLEEFSEPHENFFVWSYIIEIENKGSETVQLTQRNWVVTDKIGQTMRVTGEGVVGEQPTLHTGDSFHYISGVPLSSPSGIMHGSYVMLNEAGETFEIDIPAFSLDSPYDNSSIH